MVKRTRSKKAKEKIKTKRKNLAKQASRQTNKEECITIYMIYEQILIGNL